MTDRLAIAIGCFGSSHRARARTWNLWPSFGELSGHQLGVERLEPQCSRCGPTAPQRCGAFRRHWGRRKHCGPIIFQQDLKGTCNLIGKWSWSSVIWWLMRADLRPDAENQQMCGWTMHDGVTYSAHLNESWVVKPKILSSVLILDHAPTSTQIRWFMMF